MKITLLGTGTSQGIPVIGCQCATCTSSDPRDERLRCSTLIETDKTSIIIDVGPDFRRQMLNASVRRLDGVLITHEHNDHVIGLDDLRPLLFRSKKIIPIYGERRILEEIEKRFEYAFVKQPYPGAPEFHLKEIEPFEDLQIGDIKITPLRVFHGRLPILGFRVGGFAYLTDTSNIPLETMEYLKDLDIMVIDALRKEKHHSHNSLDDAVMMINRVGPKQSYLIHLSHLMGPTTEWEKELPHNIYPSYDGMQFEL